MYSPSAMTIRVAVPSLALFALAFAGLLRAEDDDKARLFNTFFLEGNSVTWYLNIRQDRSFDLISPDGRKQSGKIVASNKEVYLEGRHFEFKFKGTDVTFEPTKKDQPGANLAGEMPPRAGEQKARWISIQNWKAAGKDTNPPALREQPVAIEPVKVEPLPSPLARATGVAGTYVFTDANRNEHRLGMSAGASANEGTFDYRAGSGAKVTGTFYYLDGVLTLDSGFHRRHLAVAEALGGMQFTRRDTDVLKPGDTLGDMPPLERAAIVYTRTRAEIVKEVGKRPELVIPNPLNEKPLEEFAKPANKPNPAEKKDPLFAPVELPRLGKDLAELAGEYSYKPNPLVTETFVLKPDGTFNYADSNGAKASGSAEWDGAKLKLKSGEVEREFTAAKEAGGALALTRTANDNPKITNDLATMSPSVMKSAKYDKK